VHNRSIALKAFDIIQNSHLEKRCRITELEKLLADSFPSREPTEADRLLERALQHLGYTAFAAHGALADDIQAYFDRKKAEVMQHGSSKTMGAGTPLGAPVATTPPVQPSRPEAEEKCPNPACRNGMIFVYSPTSGIHGTEPCSICHGTGLKPISGQPGVSSGVERVGIPQSKDRHATKPGSVACRIPVGESPSTHSPKAGPAHDASTEPEKTLEQIATVYLANILSQREEILRAFVAKYGFEPERAVQVEQRMDSGLSRWFVRQRSDEEMNQLSAEGAQL